MLEGYWLIAEGALVAGPAAATATYMVRARSHMRRWLREPLFWEGGQPVSLVTVFAELNGEADVLASLREVMGGSGPLTGAELERGVRLLQADPMKARTVILDAATDVALQGAIGRGPATAAAGVELAERLSAASASLGFFAFMDFLNTTRPSGAPPLLPVEGMLAGGLPHGAAVDESLPPASRAFGVLGVIEALRGQEGGGWLPTIARAVEDLMRDMRVKKARDYLQRAYHQTGTMLVDALRRRSPAGAAVYRNVYSPLDAYRTLQARAKASRAERSGKRRLLVPTVSAMLWAAYLESLDRAVAVVGDKCASFEKVLAGQHGAAAAGEVLFRYRHVLMTGVAPDAFSLDGIEAARQEFKQAQEQATS